MIDIKRFFDELTVEDLCGQLLCYDISLSDNLEDLESIIKDIRPGSIYLPPGIKTEEIKMYTDLVNKHTKLPVMIATDLERGPGDVFLDSTAFPGPMSWGACDDEELIEEMGKITGKVCRKRGVHWTFSPVVDINLNPNNPVVNIRAVSDSPQQVAKMASAYARGLQDNSYIMACAKHFPGDGADDRNQHFCTSINSLSKEEWDNSFGCVFKKLFDEGIATVMIAHIALPCYEQQIDKEYGPLPAVLSYDLITKLLKGKLGFKGCVISDAMSMVGSSSRVPLDELAVQFIEAGGDVILFPKEFEHGNLVKAVNNGRITKQRLYDAFERSIKLKIRARLFENQNDLMDSIPLQNNLEETAQKIADKSIKIVRDYQKILPLNLPPNAKILMINLYKDKFKCIDDENVELKTVEAELIKRGYQTTTYHRITHSDLNRIKDDYDCILINCKISSRDYNGGSLRIGWENIMIFWRGYILSHPKVVFTSFGDPYKLYELPFLRTYINAFGSEESVQKAFVKILLGEVKPTAKNPVSLKDFFEREVGL